MTKYAAPNPARISAKHTGRPQVPSLIVIHGSVSPCVPGGARAIGRFFQTGRVVSSAHYGVDPVEVIQYVSDHVEAYHCGYNHNSIGIEMCMYPKPSNDLSDWLIDDKEIEVHGRKVLPLVWLSKNHREMLDRTAKVTAQLCLSYDIEPVFYGRRKLLAWNNRGQQHGGITTHNLMSKTFHKSVHWDPGAWPRTLFMRRVKKHYNMLKGGK
jgi:hypothetical protein